jgi:pullulanase
MFRFFVNYKVIALALLTIYLSGCSGKETNFVSCGANEAQTANGDACVAIPPPPPLVCVSPLVPNEAGDACVAPAVEGAPDPVVTAGPNEAVLFYNRPDGFYDGWVLHLWNDAPCPDSVVTVTEWPNGPSIAGIDPNYGGYFIIPLLEGFSSCMNFIVHDADGNKDLSQDDRQLNLTGDRMGWTLSGVPDVFEQAIFGAEGVPLEGAALHWVTENAFVWDIDTTNVAAVRLYYSATGDMSFLPGEGVGDESFIELALGGTLADGSGINPTQLDWEVLTTDMDVAAAKAMLKNQLIAVAMDSNDEIFAATRVQTAKALDAIYTAGDADADEANLGISYSESGITLNLWAPTAQNVEVSVYDQAKTLQSSIAMSEDSATGIWSATLDANLDRMFYRYDVTVYHPVTDSVSTLESTDPYSISLATNGRYSQLVNMADDDLKPAGWDSHLVPSIAYPEDAVIYEGHIRDFSARDESTSVANRGKYLAFTESDSVPVRHLKMLQEAGLTHFHMLPVNDIASVDEDLSTRVNLSDTVADLCAVKSDAPVCGVEDNAASLVSVLEGYDPQSDDAQTLVDSMRGLDSFNWGYDPHHFNAPEGSYSSDPDGVARITEMRAMNQSLHGMGLRVIMDNVYNHTNASGVSQNSVLDKVVPGYYHRYDQSSGNIERSTCCDNTATENRMMAKLVADSLVSWAEQYKFDGFRFDLMGHLPKDVVLAGREAVRAIDEDTYFYGEGWNFGEVAGDRLFVQARQDNMAGTEVGTFNDRIREAVRGGALFSGETNDGVLNVMDTTKIGLAGTLTDYIFIDRNDNQSTGSSQGAYASDPADIINYISVHDNETLWDQFNLVLPADISTSNRVRAQNVALAIPMLSQGIPFFHMGADLLRSKSMDRNTFDSGDWYNYLDFTKMTNNWGVGVPLLSENGEKIDQIRTALADVGRTPTATDIDFASSVFVELLQIRSTSKLFRLNTAQDISARLGFHTVGGSQTGGVIVMSIDDGIGLVDIDPTNDAVVVMVNATSSEQAHTVATAAGFELHSVLANSVDTSVQNAAFAEGTDEGTFTVPAYTVAVFVKPQGTEQGVGLSAFGTTGDPDVEPYSTTVFLRGSMNDWADPPTQSFNYEGDDIYSISVDLTADTEYFFKVASADWAAVNFGADTLENGIVTQSEEKVLIVGNENLSFTPTADGTYIFSVDASDPAVPVLTINNEEPFQGTSVYLRGSMNEWGITDPLNYDGDGIYFAEVALLAGDYAFKVASEDWATVDFGLGADATVGTYFNAVAGAGDITISIATDGNYVFSIDATDISSPTVSVFEAGMYGDTEVFVRGSYNGWGADEAMSFDGSFTYSQTLELDAGELAFKVADADWATINKGASTEGNILTFGKRLKTETNSGGDLILEVPAAGMYLFELKGPDAEFPTVTVTPQQ